MSSLKRIPRKFIAVFVVAALLLLSLGLPFEFGFIPLNSVQAASGYISYTGGDYTQKFDTLASLGDTNTWTDGSTINGWYALKNGSVPSTYKANDGSSVTHVLTSAGNSSDRAIGAYSYYDTTMWGVKIRNSTGITLTSFTLTYTGEQWRDQGTIDVYFSYSTDANGLSGTGATYTDVSALNFIPPNKSNLYQLNGNNSTNRVTYTSTVTISGGCANGTDLWLRWSTGPNQGALVAVDDLTFSASGSSNTPTPTPASTATPTPTPAPTSTPTPTPGPTSTPTPTPTSTPASGTIIVDNTDSTGVTITGSWNSINFEGTFVGTDFIRDGNTGKGTKSITYTPNIGSAGYYSVYVNFPDCWSGASNTFVQLTYNGGTEKFLMNQGGGIGWVFLGTYSFNTGTGGNVVIKNDDSDGMVYSDAVKFIPVAAMPTINPVSSPSPSDEYDTLRNKQVNIITGGSNYNPNDSNMAEKLLQANEQAQMYWDTMNKAGGRTYLWKDADNVGSWAITYNYNRLRAMAIAYMSPYTNRGFTLAGNTQLRGDIISALDWMYTNKFNENTVWGVNWFDYEIAAPLALNDITCMLYPYLTSTQITNYMNTVERFSPDPTKYYYDAKINPNSGSDATGANRIWKTKVVAVRGVIVKNSSKIATARDAMSPVLDYVTTGDGFYTDGSFIQHSYFPYAGGYGNDILNYGSDVLNLLNNSTWAVTDTDKSNMFKWVYDSFEPWVYNGDLFGSIIGRSNGIQICQNHVMGFGVINGIAKMVPYAPSADAAAYKRMIKQWVQQESAYNIYSILSLDVAAIINNIMNDSNVAPRGELVKSHVFNNMDRVVHLRSGFGFGLSMTSSRIANYESMWNQNKKAWYTGDGMTYLYNGDQKRYSEDFWGTVNPYRLPGTTVDTQTRSDAQAQGTCSTKNWVGGSEIDGIYSTAGMEVGAYNVSGYTTSLTAKKSWFMFDNEIVCLGSGITSSSGRTIETTVENEKINSSGINALTVNGTSKSTSLGWSETMSGVNYIHLSGNTTGSDVGYYFPSSTTVKGLREARSVAWTDMDNKGSSALTTRNYLTLWLDHGTDPSNSTYQYVILPNMSASQVSTYAGSPDITVLENSTGAQGVKENSLNITGVNYWNDISKTVGGITSDKKASVMMKETTTQIEVVVSDPTQANTGNIVIQINKTASSTASNDSQITVNQLNTIRFTVNVNGSKGKTFKVTFNK